MADAVPQNFSNHGRLDPTFHFFVLPVFAVTLIATIIHLVRRPGLHSAWLVVFMVAAIVALFKIRLYTLQGAGPRHPPRRKTAARDLVGPRASSPHRGIYGSAANRTALRVRCRTPRARGPCPERETLRSRYQESSPALAPRLLESMNERGSRSDGRPSEPALERSRKVHPRNLPGCSAISITILFRIGERYGPESWRSGAGF